jgi:hypothetical protein
MLGGISPITLQPESSGAILESIMANKGKGNGPELEKDKLLAELESLRARITETEEFPDLASEALRKARARTEEYRIAYGVATDELARARALLTEAWRALRTVEFSAPAYNIDSERRGAPRSARKPAGRDAPSLSERGACPACGGFGSHSPACELARAMDSIKDPRPRRRELEDSVDRAWLDRTGEADGVLSRLAFLDVLFAELVRWGLVRED